MLSNTDSRFGFLTPKKTKTFEIRALMQPNCDQVSKNRLHDFADCSFSGFLNKIIAKIIAKIRAKILPRFFQDLTRSYKINKLLSPG